MILLNLALIKTDKRSLNNIRPGGIQIGYDNQLNDSLLDHEDQMMVQEKLCALDIRIKPRTNTHPNDNFIINLECMYHEDSLPLNH